jgi:Ca-activated chloride channel homolog
MSRDAALRWSRLATLAIAVALSIGVQYLTLFPGQPTSFDPKSWGCLQLVVASSQEKASMLRDIEDDFNRQQPRVHGRCVTVKVEQIFSGDAEATLARGWNSPYPCTKIGERLLESCDRPDVWSPASRAWLRLFNATSNSNAPKVEDLGTLFKSPLVIGMPLPVATSLGYPTTPIGWQDVLKFVDGSGSWASAKDPKTGKPWGKFKLGKTTPVVSTSGLLALVATYYTANGNKNPSPNDVNRITELHDYVSHIESSVIHYGSTAGDFLQALQFADQQPQAGTNDYVSAILLQEKELFDYNNGVVSGKNTKYIPVPKLVPIYPPNGVFVADHPYLGLTWGPGRPDPFGIRMAAAESFFNFVTVQEQSRIENSGFRFEDPASPAGDPSKTLSQSLCAIYGADTTSCNQLVNLMSTTTARNLPDTAGLLAELGSWDAVRKPTKVLVLVDSGGQVVKSKPFKLTLPAGLSPRDQIGFATFPPSTTVVPIAPATGPQKDTLIKTFAAVGWQGTKAQGLLPAIQAAIASMNQTYAPDYINAVLLIELAPVGTISGSTAPIMSYLQSQPSETFVRVFTVGPDAANLQGIASAGRGAYYPSGSIDKFIHDSTANIQSYTRP